jgi:hypothetical protein
LTAPEVIDYPEGFCFSEANTVDVIKKGVISIKDLQIGDFVMAFDGTYDRVYSFGHYQPNSKTEYYQIHLQGRRQPLEISKDHLLFVENKAIPASHVTVGDMVNLGTGESAKVKEIHIVLRSGAYAPFTMSGTIIVSGVVASSYVTLQQNSRVLVVGGYRTPISMHWLAHVFQSPHRLVCLINVAYCKSESYSTEGISTWVKGPLHLCQWLLQQSGLVLTAILAPAFLLAILAYVIEAVFSESKASLIGVCCLGVITVVLVSFHQPKHRKTTRRELHHG